MNSDATTDQILSRLCEVLNDGMGRFEARARGDKTTGRGCARKGKSDEHFRSNCCAHTQT